jgi:hypothetical protein
VDGAQFVPGPIDVAAATSGPTINVINTNNNIVFPGAMNRSLTGSAAGTTIAAATDTTPAQTIPARAILIGLDGDSGHWILPTGAEDLNFPGSLTFGTHLSFSPEMTPGSYSLVLRAVDADGMIGPPQLLSLMVLSTMPTGALVVTLIWDVDADLDLHLHMPDVSMPGKFTDVWAKAPLALPPVAPGDPPYTSDEIAAAGKFDFDSNSQCRIDGRRQEDVVFPNPPPSGDYEVRVDAFSMCGQVTTRWRAVAVAGDQTLGDASGQMSDNDSRGAHTATSGLLAFRFSIP